MIKFLYVPLENTYNIYVSRDIFNKLNACVLVGFKVGVVVFSLLFFGNRQLSYFKCFNFKKCSEVEKTVTMYLYPLNIFSLFLKIIFDDSCGPCEKCA